MDKRKFVTLVAGAIPLSALILIPKTEAMRLSTNSDKIDLTLASIPSNPSAGILRIYPDTNDEHLKIRNSVGTVIDLSLENLNDLTEKDHSSLASVTSDQHHAQIHIPTHISGGADPFTSAQLLEAIIKRIQESGGPTTLTIGSIVDGEYLKRNGASIDSGSPAGGGNLDDAYDYGGAGSGRQITVDSSPVEFLTPNVVVIRLGNATAEGGDIEIYRDGSGTKAFYTNADGNPILTLRSSNHDEFLRIYNGSSQGFLGMNTITGKGASDYFKVQWYGGQTGLGISNDGNVDHIIIFGDSGADRIRIDCDDRIILGDSAVMGFSVETTDPTLGSLGAMIAPCKTGAGAMTDGEGGDRDGAFGSNSNDSTIEVRLGGSWLSVAVAGYLIPKKEKICPICNKEMKIKQFVAGYRDKDYSDGRGHWLACHFKCALRESEKKEVT